ncbi:MAD2 mitotic arrest deficient-like 1 [Cichlidogyrus casuarinus]|uniref:MAD2 mitotic arrest deficient-like 1 n=1 Tax=Cichlidogyrus casuarinus TaxID=1844966 RepID=A0ABD2Q4W5_9PLAT
MFKPVEKFEMKLFELRDKEVNNYFDIITNQIRQWSECGALQRIVLVLKEAATGETVERWQFVVEAEDNPENMNANTDTKKIGQQIRDVLRQIFASVALLPTLNSTYSFDLLIYTNKNAAVPEGWDHTGPHLIKNCENIPLKSFSTTVHRVESSVTFKR